ncbi:hypothetical protein MNBD_GAMMA08-2988 [hydrothermal vent metagenome]|uniref:Uncharacterized protein n=1 Tax=hydrothermal vent metagenome TaxID=652676 RepID=A0A3B0XKM4_9ZZZZ
MSLLKPDLENINVPNWVRFIAQDADGAWWGYSVEPLQNHRGWYENEVGEHIKLLQTAEQKHWQQCVFKVQ